MLQGDNDKERRWPRAIGGYGQGWKATKPEIVAKVRHLAGLGRSARAISRILDMPETTVRRIVSGGAPKTMERSDF